MRIVGARYLAVDEEHRREDLAYRLTKPVGRVLHARRLLREAAIPRVRAPQPPVIEPPHDEERQADHRRDDQQEYDRAVARLLGSSRDEPQPPARQRAIRKARAGERVAHEVQLPDHEHRQQAEDEAAEREPEHARALPWTCVARLPGKRVAVLAEERDTVD